MGRRSDLEILAPSVVRAMLRAQAKADEERRRKFQRLVNPQYPPVPAGFEPPAHVRRLLGDPCAVAICEGIRQEYERDPVWAEIMWMHS